MSKILKNPTNADIAIVDVGNHIIPANNELIIQPIDYDRYASSSDVITELSADLILNDSNSDLSLSDAVDHIKGTFPKVIKTESNVTGDRDSFGRKRVSNISNVFESTHASSEQTEFWDVKLVGGGSKTYTKNKAEVSLDVGTASGDRVVRQTFNYFHYAAGESLIVRMTGILGLGKTNLETSIGYNDDNNGLIFRVKDGVFAVGIRSKTTGSVVNSFKLQSEFDIDKMDGSGKSGITLDLATSQIFQTEMQYLGVGTVTLSVVIDEVVHNLHKFHHTNDLIGVYMSTPHLPIRYEIKNNGVTASASSLKQFCVQVANEGRNVGSDLTVSVDNRTTTRAINNSSFKPVLAYRHKSGNNILTEVLDVASMVTTADDVLLEVFIDATLTGASWVSHSEFLEKDVSATAISGGRSIGSFYVSKDGFAPIGTFKGKNRIGNYIDGTSQTITVCAKSFSSTANIVAKIAVKEFF